MDEIDVDDALDILATYAIAAYSQHLHWATAIGFEQCQVEGQAVMTLTRGGTGRHRFLVVVTPIPHTP